MPRSFKEVALAARIGGISKDPRTIARAVLGVLLLANLIAAYTVMRPVGGSAEELDAEVAVLRQQLQQRQRSLQRMRALTAKIEQGRKEGDGFLNSYFLQRRTAFSTIVGDLEKYAKDAGIRPRGATYVIDPVEGSDALAMMTITANFEGTYRDLLEFINRLDKSPRFLILDSLTATPQLGQPTLNVAVKFNSFVREDLPQL